MAAMLCDVDRRIYFENTSAATDGRNGQAFRFNKQASNQSVNIEKTVHACSYKFCAHAIISFILQALKNK